MDNYIPYNSKLTEDEIKSLYLKDVKGGYNIIELNDYNNILKSFNEKKEKEQYLLQKAQERKKLQLKGQKLTDRIKSKSVGNTLILEPLRDRQKIKENEKQKVDEEWEKMIEKERMEVEESIKKKKFNARNDVIFFNKKIQESNIYYERQLQIELKKQRKALQDKIDKEYEKKQLDHIKGELLYEKMQEQKNKLKEIEAGKHIKEQILHNKELKKQMKKAEEEAILKSTGLIFDHEKTEEEKKEFLKQLYDGFDKQIQLKNRLRNQKLEEEKKLDKEIIEYNNNKSIIDEKIKNARNKEINRKIRNSELVGKDIIKSERRKKIDDFYNIIANKESIFNDKEDEKLQNQFLKHLHDDTQFQMKQIKEAKEIREKEKNETKQYYYEQGIKALNELKEEEAKRAEKIRLMNLEQMKVNEEIIKEKKKRHVEEENKNLNYLSTIEEKNKKDDSEFNNYVLQSISELEANGKDTRNLYSSLITDKEKNTKKDNNCLFDSFRRTGINGIHNADDDIITYLKNNKNNYV
ncbi:hypothetical protein U3516DRAFT_830521 [Neocallimastix sp. 'constans']